ncbi:MAG: hypothetical protein A2Z11_00920 [Candidatus Woykebacteria bacterium RBG_16_43_9]|uniref:Glycosyl transferase n=1 Tax=Candidatus Woykebacteria bacterium RBG_16_43_9 TaxID=1802596 RepID=A0A1G1WIM3_9BACT|nr:MAG: hypothetical protein A2Z11_00920 [Candidatus Woykebacteria bacterium RBG_16_43_9]
MKIAQIAPLYYRIPPEKYGGTERVVHYLTEELVKRGHDVTLFASGDSETRAKLVPIVPKELREQTPISHVNHTILEVAKVYRQAENFDLIHNNAYPDYLVLPAAKSSSTPTVTTVHLPVQEDVKRIFQNYKNLPFVSISKRMRKSLPGLNYVATIYHGIPTQAFPFRKTVGDFLLFVGRISEQKGTHTAIEVAEKLSMKLVIAAKLDPTDSLDYFNEKIKPKLKNKNITWVGEVDERQRNILMSKALCLLNPINWEEPFGLVMIEAMATGCPVVVFNHGSASELVINGKTGFIVNDINEIVEAIKKVKNISPIACRGHVENNFSLEKMVNEYEKLFKKIARAT